MIARGFVPRLEPVTEPERGELDEIRSALARIEARLEPPEAAVTPGQPPLFDLGRSADRS